MGQEAAPQAVESGMPARRSLLTRTIAQVLVAALVLGLLPAPAEASLAPASPLKLPDLPLRESLSVLALAVVLVEGAPCAVFALLADPHFPSNYHRARWMDPRVGRFVGMDPHRGVISDPPTLHRYLYAGADPVNRIDPSGREYGLSTQLTVAAIVGSLAGGLIGGIRAGVEGAVAGAVAGLLLGPAAVGIATGVGGLIAAVFGVSTTTGIGIASATMGIFSLRAGVQEFTNARTVREQVAAGITIALVLAPLFLGARAASSSSSTGVVLRLRYRLGWTQEQIAAADAKVASLNQAAQAGEAARTTPLRGGTSAATRYRVACSDVPAGCDVDHILDLQLGGEDVLGNMNPLDLSVNRSLGSQIYHQTKDMPLGTRVIGVIIGN